MQKVLIVFDGGSRGNPGEMFGSFQIRLGRKRPSAPIRVRMGYGTNNEAEYLSLLSSLLTLIEYLKDQKIKSKDVHLEIKGDSQLVINQLEGTWKAKDQRMRSIRDRARKDLVKFGSYRLSHQSRQMTVRVLGH